MLENDGIATEDLIESVYPNKERRQKGAFAVIECFQNIPCNPCFSSCPKGAIKMEDINDLPKVDFDKCNGCGICMSICPGLAIFIIDETYSDTEALIRIPYEFLPLPNVEDTVIATDRQGNKVCSATVKKIINSKSQNKTATVCLSVAKELSREVRFFKINESDLQKKDCSCSCTPLDKIDLDNLNGEDNIYVCRCEEIKLSTIKNLIDKGYASLDEIKRITRAGMGACQGRTCRQLIMNLIASKTGQKQAEQSVTTFRPTVVPIKMSLLCKEEYDSNE